MHSSIKALLSSQIFKIYKDEIMNPGSSSENAIKEEKNVFLEDPHVTSLFMLPHICTAILAFPFQRRWGGWGEICQRFPEWSEVYFCVVEAISQVNHVGVSDLRKMLLCLVLS